MQQMLLQTAKHTLWLLSLWVAESQLPCVMMMVFETSAATASV